MFAVGAYGFSGREGVLWRGTADPYAGEQPWERRER